MVDRDVLARIMRAVEEVERRKGTAPPSTRAVYAGDDGAGWPGVTTDDGEVLRVPSRFDLDYGTEMPRMMLPSDFERVIAPIYPGFRPVHGAGDSGGGGGGGDDAPAAAAAAPEPVTRAGDTSTPAVGTGSDPVSSGGASSSSATAGSELISESLKAELSKRDLDISAIERIVDGTVVGSEGGRLRQVTVDLLGKVDPEHRAAILIDAAERVKAMDDNPGGREAVAEEIANLVDLLSRGGKGLFNILSKALAAPFQMAASKIASSTRAEVESDLAVRGIRDALSGISFADYKKDELKGRSPLFAKALLYALDDIPVTTNNTLNKEYQEYTDVMTTPGNVLLSLYEGGKAVPAKVANWVRESVGSCASGVGKTLKRDEMARVVAAMYPDLPAEFVQKAAKPSLCLLLGDEIVGRTISDLCRQGLAGGPDTQRRLIEIAAALTKQPAASLVALPREALCSLAANASSTKQRAGAMHAAKLLDPIAGVDWSKVGAQASSALSTAARGGRAAFDASKVIGGQLYDGTNAVLRSPVTRTAARMAGQAAMAGGRMAGQAAMAGGRMAGQAAMAGGRMAGRAAMDMVAPPPFEIHGVTQHRAYRAALESAHRMRSDRIASAMNPYTGVEKGKAPKVSRAMPRDGNPYVGYGNAGYLGSKPTSTDSTRSALFRVLYDTGFDVAIAGDFLTGKSLKESLRELDALLEKDERYKQHRRDLHEFARQVHDDVSSGKSMPLLLKEYTAMEKLASQLDEKTKRLDKMVRRTVDEEDFTRLRKDLEEVTEEKKKVDGYVSNARKIVAGLGTDPDTYKIGTRRSDEDAEGSFTGRFLDLLAAQARDTNRQSRAAAAVKIQSRFKGMSVRNEMKARPYTDDDVRMLNERALKLLSDATEGRDVPEHEKRKILRRLIEDQARHEGIRVDGIEDAAVKHRERMEGAIVPVGEVVDIPIQKNQAEREGLLDSRSGEMVSKKVGRDKSDNEWMQGEEEEEEGVARQARYARSGRKHRAKSASAKKSPVRGAASKRKHRPKSAPAIRCSPGANAVLCA
eukprot:jgi/Mesvir1/10367/Mv10567-RA.1